MDRHKERILQIRNIIYTYLSIVKVHCNDSVAIIFFTGKDHDFCGNFTNIYRTSKREFELF